MHYVFDATVGASVIKQVASSNYSPGNSERSSRGSGAVDPAQIAMVYGAPTATFQSGDLSGVLTLISASTGLSLGSSAALEIPFNRAVSGGTFDTDDATVLAKTTGASGATALLTIQQFSASEDTDATIDVLATLLSSDGFTHPVASSIGQTISGQAFNATFGFGGVSIDSSVDSRAVGATVTPGITIAVEPKFSGFNFPRQAAIIQRDPVIEIEFADLEAAHAYGPNFEALTNAIVYFRKRADGGTYASGSVNVTATFGAGLKSVQSVGAQSGTPGRTSVRLTGKALTIATDAAAPSFS